MTSVFLVDYNTPKAGVSPTSQGELCLVHPIRNSMLGVGVVAGVVFYALLRIAWLVSPPWVALDVIVAVAGGVLLGICNYLLVRLRLRQVAQQVRETVGPLAGATLPPAHIDELEDLRQTYERAVTALARRDRYRAITDQLLSSDNLSASFRVIAEHAARALPIDGATLYLREDAQLRAAMTWNMGGALPVVHEQDTAIWRVVRENRPLLLNHAERHDDRVDLQAAALLLLPLVIADQPVGVLALASRSNPAAFGDEDLEAGALLREPAGDRCAAYAARWPGARWAQSGRHALAGGARSRRQSEPRRDPGRGADRRRRADRLAARHDLVAG